MCYYYMVKFSTSKSVHAVLPGSEVHLNFSSKHFRNCGYSSVSRVFYNTQNTLSCILALQKLFVWYFTLVNPALRK